MARFERSRGRDSKGSSPSGGRKSFGGRSGERKSFGDRPKGRRDSGRESKPYSRDRRDFNKTKVTCSSCGAECEVPFKPTSNKPVYCSDCFAKKDKVGSDKRPNRDLDIINEKLNKIMKALKIE